MPCSAAWTDFDDRCRRTAAGAFRNVLVHGYAVVDDDRVTDVILHRLDELDRLRAELAAAY